MEMTDLDMDVARQLVQLSEGETTTTTATTTATATTSSSGSCNNSFFPEKVVDDFDDCFKLKGKIVNKRKKNNNGQMFRKSYNKKMNWCLGSIAGELEDDYELGNDVTTRKRVRKYRSIVDMYSITKPIDYESM